MVTTHIKSNIPFNIQQVFEHISQFENMVEYNSSVKSAKKIDSNEKTNSASENSSLPSYEIEVDLGIKKFTGIYQVTEFIPHEKIVASCKVNDMEFEDTYLFSKTEQGTYFEIIDRTKLKGFLSMSEFLLKPIMDVQMNGNLKTLQKILEERYS